MHGLWKSLVLSSVLLHLYNHLVHGSSDLAVTIISFFPVEFFFIPSCLCLKACIKWHMLMKSSLFLFFSQSAYKQPGLHSSSSEMNGPIGYFMWASSDVFFVFIGADLCYMSPTATTWLKTQESRVLTFSSTVKSRLSLYFLFLKAILPISPSDCQWNSSGWSGRRTGKRIKSHSSGAQQIMRWGIHTFRKPQSKPQETQAVERPGGELGWPRELLAQRPYSLPQCR